MTLRKIFCLIVVQGIVPISYVSSDRTSLYFQPNNHDREIQVNPIEIFQNFKDRPCTFLGFELPGIICPIVNLMLARDCDIDIGNSTTNDDDNEEDDNDENLENNDGEDDRVENNDDNDGSVGGTDDDDGDQKTLSCPNIGDPSTTVTIDQDQTRIKISSSSTLCTLIITESRPDSNIRSLLPVARSYEGNKWEAVKGPYEVEVFCNEEFCNISFPSHDLLQHTFELSTFSNTEVDFSFEDKASRFLEQTTFGPTTETITALTDGISSEQDLNTNLLQWVHTQMYETSASSHREYFRKRSNTRSALADKMATPIHPCSPQTRWHSYTFNAKDYFDTSIEVSRTNDDTAYLLSTNNIPRTEVDSIELEENEFLEVGQSYQICNSPRTKVEGFVGSELQLKVGNSCKSLLSGNPRIQFSSTNANTPPDTIILNPDALNDFEGVPGDFENDDFMSKSGLDHPFCNLLYVGVYPLYLDFLNGTWLAFDPRLNLLDNSLGNIIPDGGGSQELLGAACSSASRSFLNEDSCVLTTEAGACSASHDLPTTEVPLTVESIIKLQTLTKSYPYIISGLRADTSPCTPDHKSRWELFDLNQCTLGIALDSSTKEVLMQHLKRAEGSNLRDIVIPSRQEAECDVTSTTPTIRTTITIEYDSICWKLIHPDEYNVYDMDLWVSEHPGGPEAITQFANNAEAFLEFPRRHDMERWHNNKHLFTFIGRFGESIRYRDLPPHLKLESVLNEFSANMKIGKDFDANVGIGQGVLVCGSPGEIRNDHSLGETGFHMRLTDGKDDVISYVLDDQKRSVWTNIVLSSSDQLRQRMSWALSQVFAVDFNLIHNGFHTEFALSYYDIFVRHSFGNFRDILKEVAYSPAMASMLSYRASKSTAYNIKWFQFDASPDENFAREIMQMFSIGTVMLKMDGTPILDPTSKSPLLSYTNDHIMSFARAWTGFDLQSVRGNIEIAQKKPENLIDPMQIIPEWRDIFPKINLAGGYIGDTHPLCVDMPSRFFLRKGAKYRLLGSTTVLELQSNPPSNIDASMTSVVLSSSSQLYGKLCNPRRKQGNVCRLENEVVLDKNIDCYGHECEMDTLRLVQVTDKVFFEYVDPPCVKLAVYEEAKKISTSKNTEVMCGDPRLIVASEACCEIDSTISQERNCEYVGERMTYDLAVDRCNEIGQSLCNFTSVETCGIDCCSSIENYFWQDASCKIQVKVDKSGYISLVHNPQNTDEENVRMDLQRDSEIGFPAHWSEGFPSASNSCGMGACEVIGDSCLCDVEVIETSVFDSIPSSVEEVLSELHIGSFSPETFDSDLYRVPIINLERRDIKIYRNKKSSYDKNTIFEVKVNNGNDIKYFRNMRSVVRIVDTNGDPTDFSFRNPPHFMNMVESDIRDAQYETDAVLDDYFHHPNTAPFLATYFIQRFGHSNPSSRYVKEVATAFVSGTYGDSLGSGQYGDLGAMVAAIVLDREARSTVLSMDPTTGSLREPLLKLIGYMRSMEIEASEQYPEIFLQDVTNRIGQMAYEIDSVFSFFEPDYATSGPVKDASLVAPEGTRYDTNTILGLLNGLYSMTKYGLNFCNEGFGRKGSCKEGNYSGSQAILTYEPSDLNDAERVVDELATLLTAGRLNQQSRNIIQNEYNQAGDNGSGLRLAQQLIVSTPEFHSTNNIEFSGGKREKVQAQDTTEKNPFKSLTYLFLDGGVDSYNILVPHSGCKGKDMFAEYLSVRGEVALSKDTLLTISAEDDNQICDTFGIHSSLPVIQSLYEEGDLLFFANTGVLFEPVTKEDYMAKTKTQLFAHNIQQKDTQQVDAYQEVGGTGVLGRMADALTKIGHKAEMFGMSGVTSNSLGAESSLSASFINRGGPRPFNKNPSSDSMDSLFSDLNKEQSIRSGVFGKTWSNFLLNSIEQHEILFGALDFSPANSFPTTEIGDQLKLASATIQARDNLDTNRHIFMAKMRGYDSHRSNHDVLNKNFAELNDALTSFVNEMKSLGVWNDVIVVVASEFGRNLAPNTAVGTDHGWGGNYFIIGGGIHGGRILGEYPSDLTDGPLILDQGRIIPSMSWESIINGVAMWMGVDNDQDLDHVLPNRGAFMDDLFNDSDLFLESLLKTDEGGKNGQVKHKGDHRSNDLFDDQIHKNKLRRR